MRQRRDAPFASSFRYLMIACAAAGALPQTFQSQLVLEGRHSVRLRQCFRDAAA